MGSSGDFMSILFGNQLYSSRSAVRFVPSFIDFSPRHSCFSLFKSHQESPSRRSEMSTMYSSRSAVRFVPSFIDFSPRHSCFSLFKSHQESPSRRSEMSTMYSSRSAVRDLRAAVTPMQKLPDIQPGFLWVFGNVLPQPAKLIFRSDQMIETVLLPESTSLFEPSVDFPSRKVFP